MRSSIPIMLRGGAGIAPRAQIPAHGFIGLMLTLQTLAPPHRERYIIEQGFSEMYPSEAQLRIMIDTIPALAWCCLPNGTNEFTNKRWLDYTGFSIDGALDWGWKTAVHPDDLDSLTDRWNALLASGLAGEIEARLRRYDGEYRWFLIRGEPARDEHGKIVRWYGTSTDIEELKRAEKELRDIVDYVPQLIVIREPDGRSIYANRATLEYLGRAFEEFLEPVFDQTVIHPDDWDKVASTSQWGSRPVQFELESRMKGKDGLYRWFLYRFNPLLDCDGRVLRWFVTGTEIEALKQAEERAQNENLALREEVDKASMFEEIVGNSATLRAVLTRVAKVAPTESTILIAGETGTGKELIARAIHKRSLRFSRPFVSVNCAAIPQSLIASELFGHEKGAFTGASQRRLGRFEMAEGGTLFLDEVGELPNETQIALLRVLQERQFERVGGNQPIRADVRVISATNRDLRLAMANGAFRSDLFYRLSVFPIEIPPLRERTDDIPMLVEYFIDRYATEAGKKIRYVSKESMELLQSYPWPGNVRELQNVIERSVILCETETFSVDESWLSHDTDQNVPSRQPLVHMLATQEKALIETALAETRGQVSGPTGAAAKLSMRPSTLESKIRTLKINKHRFKTPSEGRS
jgi:formate hydrogenlyase transcriptional activator